ncbi:MAG: hypothetical protein RIQ81_2689 [Pseudomonadota bacterium]
MLMTGRFRGSLRAILWVAFFVAPVVQAAPGDVGAPKSMPKPKHVRTITFKQGTSKIADLKSLERFAGWLRVKTEVTDIRIEGFHCDADRRKEGVKPEEMLDYLLFIARERAEAVHSALVARGMESRRFEIVPLGIAEDPGSCKVVAMAMEPEKKPQPKADVAQGGPVPEVKPALKVSGDLGKK